MHNEVLKFPSNQEDWLKIAEGFESQANFPNCIGAIDGKHVRIINPAHSGSLFVNYKKYFSIVLLAMCDANYCFTYINVGSCGTNSDSQVFKDSNLFSKLIRNEVELPHPRPLDTNETTIPYMIVGDAAFGISRHVLRPYARNNMTHKKKIFNYRLSRARRYIESTFGIMSNKFEVFHRPLRTSLYNSIIIVKACCVLHNYIRTRDGYNINDSMTIVGLEDAPTNRTLNRSLNRSGDNLREIFANYFISPEGSVAWQDQYIY